MKLKFTAVFISCFMAVYSQPATPPQPIEQQYHISHWWWMLGVLIALAIGVFIYMLIKKDPRKDAVR